MKILLFFVLLIAFFITALFSGSVCHADEIQAARGVIGRILPGQESNFILELIPKVNDRDVFELESTKGKIVIRGSSGVAICSGFNWYLRYYCHSHVSWGGDQLNVPFPLPSVQEKVRRVSPYTYGFYLNYTTFNYTMSFWDWERWEREIDWMALNGVNLPLAMVGVEAVWQRTLRHFGLSEQEIGEFISGSGFFGWWLMGNLEGWGGPLPQGWIEERIVLQNRILTRMRELGMSPILHAFYGMVPNRLKDKYPSADIRDQGYWAGGFKRPAFLVPTDPLYAQIAGVFYTEQKKLFGDCRFFSGDPFHEGGSGAGVDLTAAGKQVMRSMRAVSPDAVWVMQGWQANPRDELIAGIDPESILILDLDCDNRPQWYQRNGWNGYPWVWCMVHNFGGNIGMFGRLQVVASEPLKALNHPDGGNLVGIGSLPEGIETNPVVYEHIYDMRWRDESPDMEQWINGYAHRRYGVDLAQTREAWQYLRTSIYNKELGGQQGTSESILCARPAKAIHRVSTWGTSRLYYDPLDVVKAWEKMLEVHAQLSQVDTYRYDLVDTTRQVLANLAQRIHTRMVSAFEAGNSQEFDLWSGRFLELIDDQERLLGTRVEFMLGRWIAGARALGHTQAEKDLYEFNARTLITTWSFKDSDLHDYSHREWAGLLKDFYKQRWQMFIDDLSGQLQGQPPQSIDYYAFEKDWTQKTNPYPTDPSGDSVQIVGEIYNRYRPIIETLYDSGTNPADLKAHWRLDETSGGIARNALSDATPNLIRNGTFQATSGNQQSAGWTKIPDTMHAYYEQVPNYSSKLACLKSEGGKYIEQIISGPVFGSYDISFDLGYRRDAVTKGDIQFRVALVNAATGHELAGKDITLKDPGVGSPQLLDKQSITFTIDPTGVVDVTLRFINLSSVSPSWQATAMVDNVRVLPRGQGEPGRHGEYINSPALGQPGTDPATGTSVRFSGNQYVSVDHDPSLNPNDFSVSLWVNPAGGSWYRAAVCSRRTRQDGSPAAFGYILYAMPSHRWSFWTGWTDGSSWKWDQLGGPAIQYDVWSHIVIVFDAYGKANQYGTVPGIKRIYINGQKVITGEGSLTPNDVGTFNIGSVSDPDFYFDGSIDDVQFYDGVLTDEEIVWLYTNPGQPIGDTIPPTITAPADLVVEQTGLAGTSVDLGSAAASDNRDPHPAVTTDAPELFPLGETQVEWTATDASGNSASAVQVVRVVDTIPPEATAVLLRISGGDSDEGLYQVRFDAEDICDIAPTLSAVIKVCGRTIPVAFGQTVEIEFDDDCEVEWDDGRLEIEAQRVVLEVTAVDFSGNTERAEAVVQLQHDD